MRPDASRPRPLTAEQRRAVEARRGAWLLAANAGSGKTAVIAERFVAAVLSDGVEIDRILALTFTEKAAGELRERIRARLLAEGAGALARESERAWIGTIHGFCARVLRSHPLAAGLDPAFEVLDDATAMRLRGRAWDAAVGRWLDDGGAAALDLAAAYGLERLRPTVLEVHDELRSRGATVPELPLPPVPPAPDLDALDAAAEAAVGVVGPAHERRGGVQLADALAALRRCRTLVAETGGGLPRLGEFDALAIKGRSAAELRDEAVGRYDAALAACRQRVLDAIGHRQLGPLAALVGRFAAHWARLKRERSAVDFEDLELGVRDLLAARPDVRARWAERFELVMVDEFQDTNPLQMEVLGALERDNLFAVGDERQSIYAFRHADVRVLRRWRDALGQERTLALRRNFRSREELLDVVNVAFATEWGEGFQPLESGRSHGSAAGPLTLPGDADELRLFDPSVAGTAAAGASGSVEGPAPPGGDPPVELVIVDEHGWDGCELGLDGLEVAAPRRAEAHAVAQRVRALVDAGRRPRDVVVLVRATASLRVFEQALEQRGLPTYVVGGRGYWSLEPVRDGIAYLAALDNPLDEAALLGVLASPMVGLGTDGLVLAAEAGRACGDGLWAALRAAFVESRRGYGTVGAAAGLAAPGSVGDGAAAAGAAAADGAGVDGTVAGHAGVAGDRDWAHELPPAQRERLAAFCRCFAAERTQAPRHATATLLERGARQTDYDRALLARPSGDRQLANLRKLIRLAREFEAAERRDVRAFVEHARAQKAALTEAREGDAPLESEDLDAVRLMTIHRAKGLEFPVVVIGDLGRRGQSDRGALLVGEDGRVGLRVTTLERESGPALDYEPLAAAAARADDEEERRLFYVALTRAEQQLVLSGVVDTTRWPEPTPGAPPLLWLARRLLTELPVAERPSDPGADPPAPEQIHEHTFEGRPARVAATLLTPAVATDLLAVAEGAPDGAVSRPDAPPAPGEDAGSLVLAGPRAMPGDASDTGAWPAHAPVLARLSYSALAEHERCGYRFYLRRVLGLSEVAPPDGAGGLEEDAGDDGTGGGCIDGHGTGSEASGDGRVDGHDTGGQATGDGWGIAARERGTLVHALLERIDWRRPAAPTPEDALALAAERTLGPLTALGARAASGLVAGFLATPLARRLEHARDVRHEAPFAFALPGVPAPAPLVHGRLDVVARERGGRLLIVDYKTDRLDGEESPTELVERLHAAQRVTYALAGLRSGARTVEVVYCLLERPDEPVAARFAPHDEPALAERLAAQARDALSGAYPVTADPHYDLCATCPGRAALCSHPPARTLRRRTALARATPMPDPPEPPEPSAGSDDAEWEALHVNPETAPYVF